MKSIFTLTLCVLVVLNSYGQKQSVLTTGLGYPAFLGTSTSNDMHYNYSINGGNYYLYLEKDINLFRKLAEFRIAPGFAFINIDETYKNEALGGGGKAMYRHKALSTYMKILYEIDREPYVVCDYYFGFQLGYYLHSKTSGTKSSWQVNPNPDDGEGHFYHSVEVDTSGKDFFHKSYFGLLAGLEPMGDKNTYLRPKIELAFYPVFATVNDYYVNNQKKKRCFNCQ
ncbi:hypothetical protein [uncultured Draconibacterium sp.]|uniref:hypothetical protein n=1 Tax=uncultured Draconibacterium sp. TaxID=1573823 RepID=UPI003260FCBF